MAEQLNLLPWSRVSCNSFFAFYYKPFYTLYRRERKHNYKEDAQVYVRFTAPTWKRRGQVAIAILPNYRNPVYGDWFECYDSPLEFECLIIPTRQNRFEDITISEPSIELAMLKVDILASEKGYIINDAFNFSILNKDI